MKQITLFFFLILLSSCTVETDYSKGIKQLQAQGYKEFGYRGTGWIPYENTEVFATGFIAVDSAGIVHEGWFFTLDGKHEIIRFK